MPLPTDGHLYRGEATIGAVWLARHYEMEGLFNRTHVPSTRGSFLREFRFGHIRQLDSVASGLW